MKPGTILLCLIALAVTASGWGYAWKVIHFVTPPAAVPFSDQEEIMFSLQEQIEILELEMRDLRAQLRELEKTESESTFP